MKKRISSIFLMMLALLTSQKIVAASQDAGGSDVIFEETFATSLGEFTMEGEKGDNNDIWFIKDGCAQVECQGKIGTRTDIESYLVSPKIKIGTNNSLTFNHKGSFFQFNMNRRTSIVIRTEGGEWTPLDIVNKVDGMEAYDGTGAFISAGDILIPTDFENKTIQFAFKYIASSKDEIGTWMIKNVSLKGTKAEGGDTPAPEEQETLKTIFEEPFWSGTWEQTFEGTEGVWQNDNTGMGGIMAEAQYLSGDVNEIKSSFITKAIKLFKKNTISFNQKIQYFKASEIKPEDYLSVSISAVKNGKPIKWNILEGVTFPAAEFEMQNTGEITIPEDFEGLEVMFKFTYTAKNKSESGVWVIKDIKVSGMVPAPKPANISYDVTEFNYELGTGAKFEAPVLNNPNNAKVHYEAGWELVNVDYETGKIHSFTGKAGKAVVKAIAEETVEFLPDTASYTINITNPYVLIDDLNNDFKNEEGNAWMIMDGRALAMYNKANPEYSYLVSPEIKVPTEGANVSFSIMGENIKDWANALTVSVKANEGEWEDLTITNYPEAMSYDEANTGEIKLPESYNGKSVVIGLKYHNIADNANVGVSKFVVAKNVIRKEAGIAYEKSEYAYEMGSNERFIAPKVQNPNNLEIRYTMSEEDRNKGVVYLDEMTGEVEIKDVGEVTIVAKTEKNYKFLAGEASYKLSVTDPYLILKAKFAGDSCNFTTEGVEGIWKAEWGNTSASSNPDFKEGEKAYFVSPEIQMRKAGNTVSWEQSGFSVEWEKQAHFAVREGKGEWVELTGITYPEEGSYAMANSGSIDIPAQFNSKKVQVAFVFISNGKEEPNWNIQNLIVRSSKRLMVDPEISFDKDTVTFEMSSDQKFVAPTLSNPNNVEIKYTSSNEKVATITEAGEITFIGRGETTITATSVETDKFDIASASYVLVVINKVDPEIAFEKETVEYNLASDELFVEPKLKNENKVAVKYSSSNVEIATVDEATGKVTFAQKEGKTTIKAVSEETEEFLAAEASYELVVVKTVDGIEAVLGVDLKNAKIYDLQGRKVNKLGKGMFIINGKKVVIK